jgi:integrase
MANLKATIVVRVKQDGKRKWVVVDQDQGQQSYYMRYCLGSRPKYVHIGDSYSAAKNAQLNMEAIRRQGLLVADQAGEEPEPKPIDHLCETCLQSYLTWLRAASTRKRNGRKFVESSIRVREFEIRSFLKFSSCVTIEEVTREKLLAYRDHLWSLGREANTIIKKMVLVTGWLKRNQVFRVTGLLQEDDLPPKKKSKANPYHRAEIEAIMAVSNGYRLLLRVLRATGFRKQEICHLEKSDLNPIRCTVRIQPKKKYNWFPKTPDSEREIKISKALMRELMALPDGLLFPAEGGGIERHLDRAIKSILKRAGVSGHTKPVHDWRDTFATEKVRQKVHDLITIARMMGHADLDTMQTYVEWCQMNSEEAELSAEMSDPESVYVS